MKSTTIALNLIEAMKGGWAFLGPDFRIQKFNSQFNEIIHPSPFIQNAPILEILPELVGLEGLLQDIISEKKSSFSMPQLSREMSSDHVRYFGLFLLGTQIPEQPVLIVVLDETEEGENLQKLQQQAFEIKLMRNLLNEKQAAVAAGMIGSSEPMKRLKSTIDKLSKIPNSTVLIQGETGTGKSLVARMIHLATDDTDRPFVEFNCAAVPESLLESELFGHEKGAFTHALTQKKGLLEEANGGTLFLDEIGDIQKNLQSKLLTVLDSRKFRRLGSTKELNTRFRLIAATHQDLEAMVKEGEFREDLYYRIQVIALDCPPLRSLGEDVIQIACHFIQVYAKEFGKAVNGLTPEAERILLQYDWPGNVRELRNVIERAMIFTENLILDAPDISIHSLRGNAPDGIMTVLPESGLSFEELEKRLLRQALKQADGNQSRAAKLLQMSRDTFRYRLEKHGLLQATG